MDRRTFLVSLTPLVAGCFGGRRSQSTDDPAATDTVEPTPTATPEPTATPTATATPEPEASAAATELIGSVQDQLTEAVYVYTGGVSGDLLSVTADTESFRAREVLLRLGGVQRSLAEAEAEATTDDQRATVESLDTVQRFLTQATDAQSWLIDGHDALSEAYNDIDDGDLDAAETGIETAETAAEEVDDPMAIVRDEMNAASAAVLDVMDETEYENKVSQLASEAEALSTLAGEADEIRNGVSMIERARDEVVDDRTDRAADTADRAYGVLSDVEDRLDELLDDLPGRADAFEEIADDMRYLASRSADDADTIYERYA
ncbi:hypothetical protein [Haloplanus sp.]|uniref:hypothetical protein n=1 Tax=Haloplanus sp. TaxID=1961696 RepID=UPI00262C5F40|nr:hypothetical protein [Haloplanus sp.]